MLLRILTPVLAMASLGLIFGVGLAYALKIFGIKPNELITKLLKELPGVNCGACGKAGCSGFAEALASGEVVPGGCVVAGDGARKAIATILGLNFEGKQKKSARVLCSGGKNAKDKYEYNGLKSCKAASFLFGGHKACSFGCLGLGDCVEACPFDAIKISQEGLPVVDIEKCTACGNCVKTCPKKLFEIEYLENNIYVKCSSRDTGPVVRRVCLSGCIGCGICARHTDGAFVVTEHLSKPDYEKMKSVANIEDVIVKCPTKVIRKIDVTAKK